MAINRGLNFRETSGFVTDGADETYVLNNDGYPKTRNGITFGWDTLPTGGRDRDSGVDARLAGMNFQNNNGTQLECRFDLDNAASHDIRAAFGDTSFTQAPLYTQFKDNTTVFATIDDATGTLENEYIDASGVLRTEAAWPGSNVSINRAFTSTILRVLIGTPDSQALSSVIAHLRLDEIADLPVPFVAVHPQRNVRHTGRFL